jgi:hypothetical protein
MGLFAALKLGGQDSIRASVLDDGSRVAGHGGDVMR